MLTRPWVGVRVCHLLLLLFISELPFACKLVLVPNFSYESEFDLCENGLTDKRYFQCLGFAQIRFETEALKGQLGNSLLAFHYCDT